MSNAITNYIWHLTFSAAVCFCYKEVILTELYLVRFALTHPNLSTSLLYVNASALVGAKSQTFDLGDEVMTAASDESKTSTSSASRL